MPNFDEMFQSTAKIKLLPVSENGRPPYWNSISGFRFDVYIAIGMSFCICLPYFVVIGRSGDGVNDVISIFQDGGHKVGNLLPGLGLVMVSV